MSILLIPFSFDFVDGLCVAVVLGFLCEAGEKLAIVGNACRRKRSRKRVAVSVGEGDGSEEHLGLSLDVERGARRAISNNTSNAVSNTDNSTAEGLQDIHDALSRPRAGRIIFSAPTSPVGGRARAITDDAVLSTSHALLHVHGRPVLRDIHTENTVGFSPRRPKPSFERKYLDVAMPEKQPGSQLAGPVAVHWGLALVAVIQLVLSAINDYT